MDFTIALTLCFGMLLAFIYLISGIKACRDRRFITARLNGEAQPPSTKKVRTFKEKIIIIHDGKREELVKGRGTTAAFSPSVMFTKEGRKVQGKLTDVWSKESTGGVKSLIPYFARSSSSNSSDSHLVEPAGQHAAENRTKTSTSTAKSPHGSAALHGSLSSLEVMLIKQPASNENKLSVQRPAHISVSSADGDSGSD